MGELEEKPSTGVWAICGTSLPVLLVGPVVCLFLTQKENRGQRGHLVVCFYSFIYFPNASDDI